MSNMMIIKPVESIETKGSRLSFVTFEKFANSTD